MQSFDALLGRIITQIINPVILLLASIAFVIFLWGAFSLIKDGGNPNKRTEATRAVLWGIVGLVIIFGVYGILNIATSTFGLSPVTPLTYP